MGLKHRAGYECSKGECHDRAMWAIVTSEGEFKGFWCQKHANEKQHDFDPRSDLRTSDPEVR